MCDLAEFEKLVEEHLGENELVEKCWEIKNSPLDGRGLFARKDIKVGEIIFKDIPLINGPRAGISAKVHCVICMKLSDLKACSKGCGLSVCSEECEQNLNHSKECEFITKHGGQFTEICVQLVRALTPIRAMFMEEKQLELLLNLANHMDHKHGFEVALIKSKLTINEEEEELLMKICYVLDANAFETVVESKEGSEDFSLRGLYPVGAILNHSCVPNTTHLFDENQRLIFKSTVFIPKGEEILNSYTPLLWATASRRHHLWATKHFLCSCKRCRDPTEFGTGLSGLKCTNPSNCDGILNPIDPLDENTKWTCDKCAFKVTRRNIGVIQSTLGSMLSTANMADPNHLVIILRQKIYDVVPFGNQIVTELKSRVVWMLGRTNTCVWNEVSTENLHFKEKLCRELLEVIEKLGAGQCKVKGFLLCELYCTLAEIHKRKIYIANGAKSKDEVERQNMLHEASEILYEDFRAPIEVKQYIDNYRPLL